jgi:NAD(P)-dependent dehydrogenase (short-subunit alcohol dehydrogenase family)
MTDEKTWLITGAGRGMGVEFAKAALAAGYNVVATARNSDAVAKAVGEAENLLAVKLDVTSTQMPRRQSRRLSIASAGSTCWLTTPPASKRVSSRS